MRLTIIAILFAITSSSCKKDPLSNPPSGNQPGKLTVLLGDYLGVEKLDSAIINWSRNGVAHSLALVPDSGNLSVNTTSLLPGVGRLRIQLFSKNKISNQSLQYERGVNISLQPNSNITITGPNMLEDVNWNPRVIFHQQGQYAMVKVTAIIGIRPGDPYFELKNIHPAWRSRIIVERAYYDTTQMATPVAVATWDCQDNCTDATGFYKNTTFFSFLPQAIGNRSWNRVQFYARFYNNPMTAAEFNFDHNF